MSSVILIKYYQKILKIIDDKILSNLSIILNYYHK